MKKITHICVDQYGEEEISTIATDRLKALIEWMREGKEYAYKGERIIENMYVKGLLRDRPEYKALVEELERRTKP